MSFFKKNQNINNLIQGIEVIAKNRCSLSETDLEVLTKALTQLKELKRKKGRTYEQTLQCVVDVIALLSKFFQNSEDKIDDTQQ